MQAPDQPTGSIESQLTEFLGLITSFDDERPAIACALGRISELLSAYGAVLVDHGEQVETTGFRGETPPPELLAIEPNADPAQPGPATAVLGNAQVAVVGFEADQRKLIVVRAAAPFERRELDLLDGVAKVLELGTRSLRLLGVERGLRAESERHSAENVRLLEALRDRQVLLERLGRIQRSIVARDPIHSTFEQIVTAVCDLLGVDSGCIRLRDRDSDRTSAVAAVGPGSHFLSTRGQGDEPGIDSMAMLQGRLIAVDAADGEKRSVLPPEWIEEGFVGGMAAPILEGGEAMGSIAAYLRDPKREFNARDRQALISLAEHASLCVAHSHALDAVSHEALHDSLTGLPNRALFLDRARLAVGRARRSQVALGVLVIDVDNFKTINDSLGQKVGDGVLVAISERLLTCLRPGDTIARLGGDEFAILLEELREPGDAARVAQSVLDSLERPFDIEGREVFLGACVGISAGTSDGENLVRDASLAMYKAKEQGRGRYEAFAPEMHKAIVDRLDLEVDLKRGIGRGELELHYQPIFSLKTGAITGMEALVRWNHPTRGLVPPVRFIPLAETSGQIHALGRWTLNAACHQGALWRARYPALPGIQMAVNVSASQLARPALVDDVSRALEQAQLEPDALTLEVTETALMGDIDVAVARLRALKSLGVRLAVDDFGVGHASLRYLKRFPLDYLKVAKDFVDEIETPGEELAILRAIIDLSRVFGLSSIAEGIETDAQRQKLAELGCELGQGFLLSKPSPAAAADDLILQVGLLGSAQPATPALSPGWSPAGPAAAS
jgi:diguanylate cyclase (GGDEF)-like protein